MNALSISSSNNVPLNQVAYGLDTLQKTDPGDVKRAVQSIQSDGQTLLTEDRNKYRNQDTSAISANALQAWQKAANANDLQRNPGQVQQLVEQIEREAQSNLSVKKAKDLAHFSDISLHVLSLFDAISTYKRISKFH